MIPNDDVQAGLITKLKADTDLTAYLTGQSATDEIRENQWQGVDFTYPAVRVDLTEQTEAGNPPCLSDLVFSVHCFGEGNSSLEADHVAGLVMQALLRKAFVGTGFTSGIIANDSLVGAVRQAERVWRSTALFRTTLWGGDVFG